ncbi:hypothetical protein [Wolbachia endosymbiont (group A) of Tiphia femorata]|uniref:hypothetical protein n=1 Tax=Wolbachia endosymbiont (group A) of Tiphia femorata TaxID=2954063 RepID=UPI00222E7DC3|nr:hypothetical protein [Wolbachia endosymbiont (group A) of Tiphia femorata]
MASSSSRCLLAGSAEIPWQHDVELALAILLYSPTQYQMWIQVVSYLDDRRRGYLDDTAWIGQLLR